MKDHWVNCNSAKNTQTTNAVSFKKHEISLNEGAKILNRSLVNDVFEGDCLDLMKGLRSQSIDLIYMDPPFGTQKEQTLSNRQGTVTSTYPDSWISNSAYIEWLSARLLECKRVLTSTGAIMVHCDWRMSHRIKVLLDDIFGEENFRNEIIWAYKRWTNVQNSLQRLHQSIFYYGRSKNHLMNSIMVDYSPTTNLDQIWQARTRDQRGKSIYATDEDGQHKIYSKGKNGVPLGDVWDIPYLNPKARERTGYPTQKPVELLLRALEVASRPGDVVLDPFCGSGTTLVAAKLSLRSFIGFDISASAVKMSLSRLSNPIVSESAVTRDGRDGFHRKSANQKLTEILTALDAKVVERNKNLDGIFSTVPSGVQVGVRIIFQDEELSAEQNFAATLIKKRFTVGLLVRAEDDSAKRAVVVSQIPIFTTDFQKVLQSPGSVRESVLKLHVNP